MAIHSLAAACGDHMIRPDGAARGERGESVIGVAVIGADDRIEYCNAQYPKLWGIPPHALIGGSVGEEAARVRMNGILFRQDAIRTRNVVRLGDGRSLELVTVSARCPAGSGLRRVTFVRDVTPAKAAHAAPRADRVLAGLTSALALLVATLAVLPPTAATEGKGAFTVAALDNGQSR